MKLPHFQFLSCSVSYSFFSLSVTVLLIYFLKHSSYFILSFFTSFPIPSPLSFCLSHLYHDPFLSPLSPNFIYDPTSLLSGLPRFTTFPPLALLTCRRNHIFPLSLFLFSLSYLSFSLSFIFTSTLSVFFYLCLFFFLYLSSTVPISLSGYSYFSPSQSSSLSLSPTSFFLSAIHHLSPPLLLFTLYH